MAPVKSFDTNDIMSYFKQLYESSLMLILTVVIFLKDDYTIVI